MSSDEDYSGAEEESSSYLYEDDSEDDEDYGLGSAVYDEELTLRPRQPRFSVLSEADILQRQAEAVRDVATVLSVDPSEASILLRHFKWYAPILLRHFKWSVSQVNDEWFHNEERVRQAVGLLAIHDRGTRASVQPSPLKAGQPGLARESGVAGLKPVSATSGSRRISEASGRAREPWDGDLGGRAGEGREGAGVPREPDGRGAEGGGAQEGAARGDATCGICFEVFAEGDLRPASCEQHLFCDTCWEGYITTVVADGPGCLSMRCPDPDCEAAVPEALVMSLAPEATWSKYKRYLLRSYVDDNRNAKWCPAPGCEYAVEFFPDLSNYDIACKCGHNFCWNCNEEAHRPVDCETVAKWILKNSAESENMNWILAHSKACPKCKRPIEKNLGCMHMTCTPPCKHEFCWLCLGSWAEHGEKTGGFYACNRYEAARHKGLYDEAERRKEMAMNSLEKYTHYYERWAANEQSRVKAMESLKEMQATKIEILSERQGQPISQLKFVTDAWLQVVECRRVLKWTYAYGFYLANEDQAKRHFFEYLQGEADSALENLHRMAEKELAEYVDICGGDAGQPELPFNEFKSRLAGLTSVTHTYFENLVRALENGLCDVEQPGKPALQAQQHQQVQGGGKRDKKGQSGSSSTSVLSSSTAQAGGSAPTSRGNTAPTSRGSTSMTVARQLAKAAIRGRSGGQGSGGQGSGGQASGAASTALGTLTSSSASGGPWPGGGISGMATSTPAARGGSGAAPVTGPRSHGDVASSHQAGGTALPRQLDYWSCTHCAFANRQSTLVCSMCNLPRGNPSR